MTPSSHSPSLPAAMLKALPTLGHAVVLWHSSAGDLLRRWNKPFQGPEADYYLRHWRDLGAPELTEPGRSARFNLRIGWEPQKGSWFLLDDASQLTRAAYLRWLLHVPALRMFWIQALREQRFASLIRHVPKVWCLDDDEPPPGSVIAGLNAATWSDVKALVDASDSRLRHLHLEHVAQSRWVAEQPEVSDSMVTSYEVDEMGRVTWVDERF